MKTLFTSDIHASHTHLFAMLDTAREKKADVIIIGGDIVPHYLGDANRVGEVKAQANYLQNVFIPTLEKFKRKNSVRIFLDMGNDDFISGRPLLEKHDGKLFYLLHMKMLPLTDKMDIAGYMNVPPTPFYRKDWELPDTRLQPFAPGNRIDTRGMITADGIIRPYAMDLRSENTIEKELLTLARKINRPFVLVSHCPPYDTPLDVIYDGTHVGSLAVRRFVETWSRQGFLKISFHGHIHESPDRTGLISARLADAVCYNPGQGNGLGAAFRYVLLDI